MENSVPDFQITESDDERQIWDDLRTRYVMGGMSLRELARVSSKSETAIMKRSAREGWVRMRADARGEIAANVRAALVVDAVEARVQAFETAQEVITSWRENIKGAASAADALAAAKIILLLGGEPTERTEVNDTSAATESEILRDIDAIFDAARKRTDSGANGAATAHP